MSQAFLHSSSQQYCDKNWWPENVLTEKLQSQFPYTYFITMKQNNIFHVESLSLNKIFFIRDYFFL